MGDGFALLLPGSLASFIPVLLNRTAKCISTFVPLVFSGQRKLELETLVLALQSQGLRLQESLPKGGGPAVRCSGGQGAGDGERTHALIGSPCLDAVSECYTLWEVCSHNKFN